jgi:hypothetical protein
VRVVLPRLVYCKGGNAFPASPPIV